MAIFNGYVKLPEGITLRKSNCVKSRFSEIGGPPNHPFIEGLSIDYKLHKPSSYVNTSIYGKPQMGNSIFEKSHIPMDGDGQSYRTSWWVDLHPFKLVVWNIFYPMVNLWLIAMILISGNIWLIYG